MQVSGAAGATIWFPTVQGCPSAEEAWIEIPAAGGAEPENVAPSIVLTADVAATTTTPTDHGRAEHHTHHLGAGRGRRHQGRIADQQHGTRSSDWWPSARSSSELWCCSSATAARATRQSRTMDTADLIAHLTVEARRVPALDPTTLTAPVPWCGDWTRRPRRRALERRAALGHRPERPARHLGSTPRDGTCAGRTRGDRVVRGRSRPDAGRVRRRRSGGDGQHLGRRTAASAGGCAGCSTRPAMHRWDAEAGGGGPRARHADRRRTSRSTGSTSCSTTSCPWWPTSSPATARRCTCTQPMPPASGWCDSRPTACTSNGYTPRVMSPCAPPRTISCCCSGTARHSADPEFETFGDHCARRAVATARPGSDSDGAQEVPDRCGSGHRGRHRGGRDRIRRALLGRRERGRSVPANRRATTPTERRRARRVVHLARRLQRLGRIPGQPSRHRDAQSRRPRRSEPRRSPTPIAPLPCVARRARP